MKWKKGGVSGLPTEKKGKKKRNRSFHPFNAIYYWSLETWSVWGECIRLISLEALLDRALMLHAFYISARDVLMSSSQLCLHSLTALQLNVPTSSERHCSTGRTCPSMLIAGGWDIRPMRSTSRMASWEKSTQMWIVGVGCMRARPSHAAANRI